MTQRTGKDAMSALTDRDGRFEFRGLPVRRYTIWRDAAKVGTAEFRRPGETVDLEPHRVR